MSSLLTSLNSSRSVSEGSTANLGSQLLNVFRFDVSAEPEDRVRTL
jgi:hypothetical protein